MLVTVVGNYPKIPNRPRPARLRNALARLDRGEISPEELAKVEDEVTKEVIREQEDAGIELVTDGQIRWLDEQTYVAGKLKGISLTGLIRFFDTNTYYRQPLVEGDISWDGPITVRDYEFAVATAKRPVKAVLTGPYTLARLSQDDHYSNLEALSNGLAEAINLEAKALQAAGASIIQFNEPAITRHHEDSSLVAGVWRRLLDGLSVETAVYFYFGLPGRALPVAIDAGFTTVGIDATIDGAFPALKGALPPKLAVGAIDSRTTRLESVEDIAARVRDAQSFLPDENIYVNPNMGLEFLPREQAQAKLVRLVEGVNRARGGPA